MALLIRLADERDVDAIVAVDSLAPRDRSRREFIRRSVAANLCYVAGEENSVLGYGILECSFFGNGFISMVFVAETARRRGVGTALMRRLEAACPTPKLFTSTNLSNRPMQSLLAKLGYALSGVIHNLDEDDPELVYYKRLTQPGGRGGAGNDEP
ncbi:MAG: GNAT family N-acetyltransferase [Candidatus Sumerlaeota bacterium]|nr:GNAT family N-acetyltransferase [Candidatus Sumerlaeota bacterium]